MYSQNFLRAIAFSQHLIRIDERDEAIAVLKNVDTTNLQHSSIDSLNHFIGYTYYLKKNLDSSAFFLSRVSTESSLFSKSMYYRVISDVYSKRYQTAISVLESRNEKDELRQLWLTEYAGIALLERNYKRFDSISQQFDYSYFPVSKEQKSFLDYAAGMRKVKRKSPFIAGTLSAIIPGAGKYYAGYRGKAVSSFFTVTVLGAVAAENYIRNGTSPGFWVFSSLFTVFYIGNIWGSALSVQIKSDETFKEYDRNILLDLHIPLRRIFN